MMRFDRFTERAQDAAMRAYEILQRYHHSQADTEHLFLALLEQPNGLVPEILENLAIEPEMVMDRILKNNCITCEEKKTCPLFTGLGECEVGLFFKEKEEQEI